MASGDQYLIVGGGGFLGRCIVEYLLKRGETKVRVFDVRRTFEDQRVDFVVGDITKLEDIVKACKGVDVVIHTAATTHLASTSSGESLIYKVNVGGTKNVIEACIQEKVPRLVYTSSASVVFDGTDLYKATEEYPYVKNQMDPYNKTKELGEVAVLEANGKKGLSTVALRPSGIFGPRDVQAWPGFIEVGKTGKSRYMIGRGHNQFDWTYVENIAYAHVLAADQLKKKANVVGGQAYFITNDEPTPFWDMARYIYSNFGYTLPWVKLPYILMWYIAALLELISHLLGLFGVKYTPTFTRIRVSNSGANRTFSIEKAKKQLEYRPIVPLKEGMKRTLEYFKEVERQKEREGNAAKPKEH